MKKSTSGFTIVELLIVIVVIAILAAISVVAYTGIQNRANDTTIKSDLSNAAKALELIKTDLGRYPRGTVSDWEGVSGFKFSKNAHSTSVNSAMYCLNITTDSYAIGAVSKSGTGYIFTKSGIAEGVSATATAVCAAVGSPAWVSDAVTSTRHGYSPSGTEPNYTNGWNNGWAWTD